jgi:hypothetical protein
MQCFDFDLSYCILLASKMILNIPIYFAIFKFQPDSFPHITKLFLAFTKVTVKIPTAHNNSQGV